MIAVTGATGFIGAEIVRRASRAGTPVRGIARSPDRAEGLAALPGVELLEGDVVTGEGLDRVFDGADAVVHLVGIIVETKRQTYEEVHVRGTGNVLAAARAAGIRRFVHMSALGAEAGRDVTDYFRTKWEAERAVRESGLETTVFRPSVVFGPGDDFTNRLAPLVRWSPVVALPGGGRFRLQPVWVGDVAECFLQAARANATDRPVYDVGGPEVMTLADMIQTMARAMGRRRRTIVPLPLPLARLGAAVLEALPTEPFVTRAQLAMLELESVVDPDGVRALTGAFDLQHARFGDKAPEWLGRDRYPNEERG